MKCRSRNKMFARQARGSTDFYISTDIPAKKENANCREYKTCVAHEIASTRNPLTLRAKGFQSRSAKHAERGTGAGGGSGESAGSEAKVSESHNNEGRTPCRQTTQRKPIRVFNHSLRRLSPCAQFSALLEWLADWEERVSAFPWFERVSIADGPSRDVFSHGSHFSFTTPLLCDSDAACFSLVHLSVCFADETLKSLRSGVKRSKSCASACNFKCNIF